MNSEDIQQESKQEKFKRFLRGSGRSELSSRRIRYARYTKLSGIIPKRTLPQQIVEKISSQPETQLVQSQTSISPRVVSSLGRVTLDLEIINNNLDKITEIIQEDFKQTKEINRKEVEEYRKRVANRGRIVGKKEFGDRKTDLAGLIKKYVGSFFSGTGGAIRALAGLNILEGIMSGNPMKILGGLTGITASYLPAIGMAVGGKLVQSMFRGGDRATGGLARGARPLSGLARGGGRLALGAGLATAAVAIGSKIFGGGGQTERVNEIISPKQDGAGGADLLMPADLLKKFDDINKKFEQAVDRLLSGGGGRNGTAGGSIDTSGSFTGSTRAQQAFSYFQSKGLSPQVSAGIVGNLLQENRAMDPTLSNSQGNKGIAQWDANRWRNLEKFARERGLSPNDFQAQLQFIFKELSTGEGGLSLPTLQSQKTLEGAAIIFRKQYERPGEAEAMDANRIAFGRDVLRLYAGGNVSPAATPPIPVLPVSSASRGRSALSAPPLRGGPTIVPVPVGGESASQTSSSVSNNDVVPSINTTYSENFLALYSKLTYQIV
jgi:hypothetical protein